MAITSSKKTCNEMLSTVEGHVDSIGFHSNSRARWTLCYVPNAAVLH